MRLDLLEAMSTSVPFMARRYVSFVPALLLSCALATASAQTKITPDRNKYTPAQDVELGRRAAAEARQQLPMLKDDHVDDYVEDVGRRLVSAIPTEFRHPEFRYTFDVINQKEINAFALPGGPMFLNRGMMESSANEAEIVGGTAGGVIAQGSQFGLGAYFLKYGREYEREADLVGAQIMARAGYDPRHMAAMFKTIEKQSGGRGGPEWLSSHPNPGNRYEAINREAAMLRVEGSPPSNADFQQVRGRLAGMNPAYTAEQIARGQAGGRHEPVGTSGRAVNVEPPSGQMRTYQPGNFMRISVPANWQQLGGGTTVTYAPQGAVFQAHNGGTAFTHGVEIGVVDSSTGNLQRDTEALLQSFAQTNPQLRRASDYNRVNVDGRNGLTTTLRNVSEVTGTSEVVSVTTTQLRDGS